MPEKLLQLLDSTEQICSVIKLAYVIRQMGLHIVFFLLYLSKVMNTSSLHQKPNQLPHSVVVIAVKCYS